MQRERATPVSSVPGPVVAGADRKTKRGKKIASSLPDELIMRILEIGVESSTLKRADVFSFSLCSKNFNKFTQEDSVWGRMLAVDFPGCNEPLTVTTCSSMKQLYKSRYVRYRQIISQLLKIRHTN